MNRLFEKPSTLDSAVAVGEPLPQEVEMVLSALEAGSKAGAERRTQARLSWRVQAGLRLFIDPPGHTSRTLYTRDVHSRGLGFVSSHRLPLGYGGVVDLPAYDGTVMSIACTLLRCRLAAPGWYEGVVYFNREQFNLERMIG
jgi:hypothetical protein